MSGATENVMFAVTRQGNHYRAEGSLYDVPIVAHARTMTELSSVVAANLRAAWKIGNSAGEPECRTVSLVMQVGIGESG